MPAFEGFADFDANKDVPSLKGKVILITGGTAGAGKASVEALARHEPEHIYFTGRNTGAAESLITELTAEYPELRLTFLRMDLSSLQDVKAAAARFAHDRLDILICNAGVLDVPPSLTVDGFQIVMATNHLGHAMLIRQLLPVLLRSAKTPEADVRIVMVSSAGYAFHPREGINWEGIRSPRASLIDWATGYGQSKLANLVYASELARRYPEILSVSVHPGFVASDMVKNTHMLIRAGLYFMNTLQGIHALPPGKGCLNQIWAAAGAKREAIMNGVYYTPIGVVGKLDKVASSEEFARKLWTWTDELLDTAT
ncbi:NAD(P)-binding protein [Xylariaceae sp. FL1651]|nr:NAD(P)-binding protein [Xylariaceae sp. FL1651]